MNWKLAALALLCDNTGAFEVNDFESRDDGNRNRCVSTMPTDKTNAVEIWFFDNPFGGVPGTRCYNGNLFKTDV